MAKDSHHLMCGEMEDHGDAHDSGAEPNLATAGGTEELGQKEACGWDRAVGRRGTPRRSSGQWRNNRWR
jgi:hypothetical protein